MLLNIRRHGGGGLRSRPPLLAVFVREGDGFGYTHFRGNGASARPEKVKHYSKAHSLLKEALGNDVWELTKSIEREVSIHYNLACCLARLSECDESVDATKRLAETLAELEAAARAGVPKLDVFSDDLNVDDGDLGALSRCADPIIRSELSRIRSLLGEI